MSFKIPFSLEPNDLTKYPILLIDDELNLVAPKEIDLEIITKADFARRNSVLYKASAIRAIIGVKIGCRLAKRQWIVALSDRCFRLEYLVSIQDFIETVETFDRLSIDIKQLSSLGKYRMWLFDLLKQVKDTFVEISPLFSQTYDRVRYHPNKLGPRVATGETAYDFEICKTLFSRRPVAFYNRNQNLLFINHMAMMGAFVVYVSNQMDNAFI